MKRNGKPLLSLLALGFLLSCTQTPEQIAEKGRHSTVHLMITDADDTLIQLGESIIVRSKGLGSGFFVARDRIVTNIHCVAGITKIRAKLVGTETFYDIEGVTASDPKNDLVILKVVGKGTPLPLGDSDAIQVGEPVIAVGNPGGEEGQISHGKIYNRRDSDEWLRLKLRLSPGNSGGPVLNNKGEAIGVAVQIISEISGDQSYAIPSNTLKALFNKSEHVESLTQWQKQEPIRAYTYYSQATSLSEHGQSKPNQDFHKQAIELLDKAIELYPDFASAHYDRGGAKYRLGYYKAAIEDFDKVIELYPNHVGAYFSRGGAKYRWGDYEAAIENFDKVIELYPNLASAYNSRGGAKYRWGDYEAAIEDFDKVIELYPNHVEAYYNRGVAKEARGQQDAAIADYNKAIELNPKYADAYYSRGVTKDKLRDYEAAIEDFDKAIQLNPNDVLAYFSRGIAKYRLGYYKAAIEDFDKAIELNPKYANAYNNRGVAKEALGQHKEAKDDFEKAKELDSNVGK